MSGDMGDLYRAWKETKRDAKQLSGVPCQECLTKLPKASPSILLPGQRCRLHGYTAPKHKSLSPGAK